jgi:thymidylate synthase (FAD)
MDTVSPQVRAIAWTQFQAPEDVPWSTDADGGQALAEFAGRACYQSWSKPNPATATNAGYLRHILESKHLSVLEHATVTFYLSGVSRSFTHELVRHRHFSYSQLSQRYVPEHDAAMVVPPVIADDPYMLELFEEATRTARQAYQDLVTVLEERLARNGVHQCPECGTGLQWELDPAGYWCSSCARYIPSGDLVRGKLGTSARKAARQAARAVLPNATETRIVVTGNYRAWRHFIDMRASEHADPEIRAVAMAILRELQRVAPNVFADYVIGKLDDGAEVASTPFRELS